MDQDSAMADAPISSPAPASAEATASPAPAASTTPNPRQTDQASTPTASSTTNANINASANTSSNPSTTAATNGKLVLPKTAAHHGAPTRDWINTHVTGVLLEGMKLLAAERPDAPLHALGVYLIKRSAEIEGKTGAEVMEER